MLLQVCNLHDTNFTRPFLCMSIASDNQWVRKTECGHSHIGSHRYKYELVLIPT